MTSQTSQHGGTAASAPATVLKSPAVGAEIRVETVRSRRAWREWIRFPRRAVYGRQSLWVPPMDTELRRLLDARLNPQFRHDQGVALLARDARGAVVGRLFAHVNHRYNVLHGERAALFGFFECLEREDAARALLNAAGEFGRGHGCSILRGPLGLTSMQEMGVLIEGFEEAPSTDEVFTASYYPALLEAAGLHRVFPCSTAVVDDIGRIDPETLLGERQRALLAEGRLRVRIGDLRHLDQEVETLRELINESFRSSPHFVPLTRDEYRFLVLPYLRLIDPELLLCAELDGVPCAFLIATPDYASLVKRMRGRAGPRAALTFVRGRKHLKDAVITLMGVQPQLEGQGIMRVLQAELVRTLRRRQYQRLVITWFADDNEASKAAQTRLGARPQHRLTLFEGALPTGGEGGDRPVANSQVGGNIDER